MANDFLPIRKYTLVAVTLAAILVTVLGSSSCSPKSYSGPIETITIGRISPAGPAFLSVEIADEEKFFVANGLGVKLNYYETGGAAIDALLAGIR